jgi:gliding motility-associated-like protein
LGIISSKKFKFIFLKQYSLIKKIYFFTFFLLLIFVTKSYSTHIVGGTLTYVYNGGSSYTVTLKLYRDCSAGTAQFPNTVNVSVVGFDGAPFTPSRDISMNLGPVTQIPSNLDPCATPPNPMPCTQEGIYTTTVNNLPPNPGGYHLYYQLIARNLSLTNVDAVCNCVGESFYAYIPGPDMIWTEDFLLNNNTTIDNGPTAWSIVSGPTPPNSASVNNNLFQITGTNDGELTWTSQPINISTFTSGVNLSVELQENGVFEASDSIFVYYRINGGVLTLFSTNGFRADDFSSAIATQTGLTGNTVEIVIRVHYNANSPNSEIYRFDNVTVGAQNFISNSNPTFNIFPPLFLCVNTPFTFDHSATDVNGDSLVYEFYNPYNGDNNAGPLDPTFPNNTATFTNVVFQPGYTFTNPLGPGPFSLNSSTGLLTGTPSALGQYVVGVLVKEYRNGVYLSSTLRDFQFNVINCPQFAQAILSPLSSCNNNTVTFSNLGGSSGSDWLWNFGDLTTTSDQSTLNNPTYTYPGAGTYIVTLITGVGTNCSDTATATLVVTSATAAFTTNSPQCIGSTVNFTNTSTVSGTSTITSTTWNFGDGTSSTLANPTHVYNTSGTFVVTLSITTSTGCNSTITQNVVINPPPIANAGADIIVCGNNASISLNGQVTNATGGAWTTNGTGTFSPNNTTLNAVYTPSVADISAGSLNFILTTTGNNGCPALSDNLLVTITNSPTQANAGIDQIICGTTTAVLAGNTPVVGTGVWTLISGTATVTNPSSPNSTITGLVPGSTYTLRWTISSPLCNPTFDEVTINVDVATTVANAGPNQTICAVNSTTLSANTAIVGTGLWTLVSGTANIVNPSSPSTSLTGLIAGTTVVLRWTISQGVCSTFDDVSVTVNQNAIVNAGPNQVFCSPVNIQLNGSVSGTTVTGTWSSLGNGTFLPNANVLNPTYILGSNDITNGSVVLILSSTNNAQSCSAISDTINVTYIGFNGAVSIAATNVSCFSGNNGSATANVNGGISPFTYFWNSAPSQTTQTAQNLVQGNYTVTITDGNGCTSQSSVQINQASVLNVSGTQVNVSCFGGTNGAVSISATGGTAPFTYLWTPLNSTQQNLTNIAVGSYSVLVTDALGCTANNSFTVSQPSQLSVNHTFANVSCFGGSNGSISVNGLGGTLPYTYNWNPNGATSSTINNLVSGNYIITMSDAAACQISDTIFISQPTAVSVSTTTTNETCNNLNNGSASVVASGGIPGYTYLWQPGAQTTPTVNNLSSGNYTVQVTDNNNCSTLNFVSISEPLSLVANFVNQNNVSCFGGSNGSVTVNAAGGTAGYTYLWLPGNFTTPTINNLSANTYTVTVTDVNGCSVTNSVFITQPVAPLSTTVASSSVICFGQSNGSVSSSPLGGTPPYNFLWSPGNTTTQNTNNLPAGLYSVLVTDSKGCTTNNSVTVNQPLQIDIVSSSQNSTCSLPNGTATATASGGVGNFSYSWIPFGGSTNTAVNLPSGSYSVIATDINGCSATQIVNVNDATGPSVTIISTTDVSCFGGADGTATAQVSSGTGPFTFQWSPSGGNNSTATGLSAGFYTVIVIDSNNCQSLATTSPAISQPPLLVLNATHTNVSCSEGSNGTASVTVSGGTPSYSFLWPQLGNTTSTLSNLLAGSYLVEVSDNNGCLQSQIITVEEPPALIANISNTTNVSCFGGSNGAAAISVTGGTPNYNFVWSPTGGFGSTAVGLSNGVYSVVVSDENNCSTTVNVVITQPSLPLSVSTTSTSTSCFNGIDGTATAVPLGGTSPYSFQWLPSGAITPIASGLVAGNYTVNVTDNNGCQTNSNVSITQPPQLNVSLSGTNSSCGFSNGTVLSQISGGTAPYVYNWSTGSNSVGSLNNVGVGSYSLQILDANNCSAVSSNPVTLSNIPGPIVSIASSSGVSCFGGSNGVAIAQVSQGTLPYSVNWFPFGGTNLVASTLTEGNFSVTVTDALGCISTSNVTILQPEPITISSGPITNVSCFGGNNGTASVTVTGGTPNYIYNWSPITSTSSSVNNLTVGVYAVTVIDQNNCSNSVSLNITQPTALSSIFTANTNPTCFGGTGSASIIGNGGTLPYSYNWNTNPIQNTSTATNLVAGSTTVIVTDALGCTTTNEIILTQPLQINTIAGINDTLCFGSTGTLTATATGGSGNFIFNWQPLNVFNTGILNVSPLATTNFFVTATDQNGCAGTTDTLTAVVLNLQAANINVSGNSPICPGQNTQIAAEISGTTGNLSYLWNNNLGATSGPFSVSPTEQTTYVLTVTNSCGVSVTDSVIIAINPPPTIALSLLPNTVCSPQLVQFFDNSQSGNSNDPINSWIWSFGDGNTSTLQNPTHIYSVAGTYLVTLAVTTEDGCISNNTSSPTTVVSFPSPTAAFTVNNTNLDIPYDNLLCTNQSTGANSYQWNFGDGSSSVVENPTHSFQDVGVFTVQLIAVSDNGCSDTASTEITTNANINFPNAFTPNTNNGNGGVYNENNLDNDVFFPYTKGVLEYKLQIFNRWGELIFETNDLRQGWDGYYKGKLCQQDVYVWKVDMTFNNGKTFIKTGDVTLLR